MSGDDVQIPVDAERLLVDWLRDIEAVAEIFDDRIYTEVPRDPALQEFPLARVQRIGGAPTSRLARLDNPLMQIDVWGGPKATALLGIETIRAWATRTLVGTHEGGVVTGVQAGSLRWLPDESFAPARPRYSADLLLWLHP
jgi:hypothetical protein